MDPVATPAPLDRLGRPLHDLRISVTDRCNFRCTYCMPKEIYGRDFAFLPQGPGPLVRGDPARGAGLRDAGRREAAHHRWRAAGQTRPARAHRGCWPRFGRQMVATLDLTLTTNGAALRALARPLADAGLRRVTVSLDSLDDAVFGAMNGVDFPVARVLDGIDGGAGGRAHPGQGQHGRAPGRQRGLDRADGPLGARDRRHAPLHRVHGRRPLERLAARRGRPGRRADRSS